MSEPHHSQGIADLEALLARRQLDLEANSVRLGGLTQEAESLSRRLQALELEAQPCPELSESERRAVESEVTDLEAVLEELGARIEEARSGLAGARGEVEGRSSEVSRREQVIASLQERLAWTSAESTRCRKEVRELATRLAAGPPKPVEATPADLTEELRARREQILARVAEARQEAEAQRQKAAELTAQVEVASQERSAADRQVEELYQRLQATRHQLQQAAGRADVAAREAEQLELSRTRLELDLEGARSVSAEIVGVLEQARRRQTEESERLRAELEAREREVIGMSRIVSEGGKRCEQLQEALERVQVSRRELEAGEAELERDELRIAGELAWTRSQIAREVES